MRKHVQFYCTCTCMSRTATRTLIVSDSQMWFCTFRQLRFFTKTKFKMIETIQLTSTVKFLSTVIWLITKRKSSFSWKISVIWSYKLSWHVWNVPCLVILLSSILYIVFLRGLPEKPILDQSRDPGLLFM